MKQILLVLALLVPVVVPAQEVVTLTAPIVKSASGCTLDTLVLDVTRSRIVVLLTCAGGDPIGKTYDSFTTPTGATLLHSINSGNFSASSLVKAVYTRLIADGVITGTVGGIPQ
jgi:hypothetical protein